MYDTAAMKMSVLDRDAAFNQAVAGVRPNPDVLIDFIHLALEWMKPEMLDQRRGTRQKNLSLKKIKDTLVPLPSLEEQKEIAASLKSSDEKIRELSLNLICKLQDLDDLRQSLLQKAFAGELT